MFSDFKLSITIVPLIKIVIIHYIHVVSISEKANEYHDNEEVTHEIGFAREAVNIVLFTTDGYIVEEGTLGEIFHSILNFCISSNPR
ncbi:hypothetical protein [Clostridium aciditolerans]|uniref:Uncharacterized protein n=1 Tax=Clostridium aciditolerans TaxID=339861 RepID=A0A934HWM5_9CLOT|nr:hypothetical protein [Clostridium aciditolerans]MBI6872664.1 hypothetical protein [Clostridium aciditolerans]